MSRPYNFSIRINTNEIDGDNGLEQQPESRKENTILNFIHLPEK